MHNPVGPRVVRAVSHRPGPAFALALLVVPVVLAAGCAREPEPSAVELPAADPQTTGPGDRQRAAAVTIRFAGGRLEPGSNRLGADRLQVAAVFADVDRRDLGFLGDLVGQSRTAPPPALDHCVRQADLLHRMSAQPGQPPHAYLQLLDIGNVRLKAGAAALGLRVQMVPSLFDATRGVRYDADLNMGRPWLAAGTLVLEASGGDGIAPFEAPVPVPRPVRLTHVASAAVRSGRVQLPQATPELILRWGSVDGVADLEVQVGAELADGLGWLRCRLRDDGEFQVPPDLVAQLPPRTAERPWLLLLVRAQEAPIPGFDGTPLRLELTDTVHAF